jgi:hypothetical protein
MESPETLKIDPVVDQNALAWIPTEQLQMSSQVLLRDTDYPVEQEVPEPQRGSFEESCRTVGR